MIIDSISDIRIRQSPGGSFAIVSIAEGFKAFDIRRQFLGEGSSKKASEERSERPSTPHDVIDLTLEDSSSEKGDDNCIQDRYWIPD